MRHGETAENMHNPIIVMPFSLNAKEACSLLLIKKGYMRFDDTYLECSTVDYSKFGLLVELELEFPIALECNFSPINGLYTTKGKKHVITSSKTTL